MTRQQSCTWNTLRESFDLRFVNANGFGFKAIGIKGLEFMWTSSKLSFKSHYIVGNWVPLMHVYVYDSKFIKKVEG